MVCSLVSNYTDTYSDKLCTLKIKQSTWSQYAFNNWNLLCLCSDEYIRNIISDKDNFEVKLSPFLQNIYQSIANKKWVDIENEYYHLTSSLKKPQYYNWLINNIL